MDHEPSVHALIIQLQAAVRTDPVWVPALHAVQTGAGPALQLAILVEPFLSAVIRGQKTIESRFSRQRRAPYGQVVAGDLLVLKRAGGPVLGLAIADYAWSAPLAPGDLAAIRARFAAPLASDDDAFWSARAAARYVTLIGLSHVRAVAPIALPRRDRRGWVVLAARPARPT